MRGSIFAYGWVLACIAMPVFAQSNGNATTASRRAASEPIAALDHMPLVVSDLDAAAVAYSKLGFALKPGRPHDNGIRNRHLKFPDGSGIELLSPERGPKDESAAHYAAELAVGEGPVHFALHARDDARLTAALRSAGIAFHREDGALSLDDPALSFLFFGGDNRSPTDRPEHFAHANSATAMIGVWFALEPEAASRLSRLLLALGAKRGRDALPLGKGVRVDVYALSNGRIALLPMDRRVRPQRPIVGVEFRVRDLGKVDACGSTKASAKTKHACLVPPSETHGLWMRFSD
jgi:hypothetical protein